MKTIQKESSVIDKAHHATLGSVIIQIMSMKAAESSRAHHSALERFFFQTINFKREELSR